MSLKKFASGLLCAGWAALILACGGGGEETETNQEVVEIDPSGSAAKLPDSESTTSTPTKIKETPPAKPPSPSQSPHFTPYNKGAKQGDFLVTLTHVTKGNTQLKDIFGDGAVSQSIQIQIGLEITNQSQTKKINYRGWGADWTDFRESDRAELEDEHGNFYRRITFSTAKPVGQVHHESLYPGKSVRDVVVFEPPIAAAKELRLTLPAVAFGGSGVLRFSIPASVIGWNRDGSPPVNKPDRPTAKAKPMPDASLVASATEYRSYFDQMGEIYTQVEVFREKGQQDPKTAQLWIKYKTACQKLFDAYSTKMKTWDDKQAQKAFTEAMNALKAMIDSVDTPSKYLAAMGDCEQQLKRCETLAANAEMKAGMPSKPKFKFVPKPTPEEIAKQEEARKVLEAERKKKEAEELEQKAEAKLRLANKFYGEANFKTAKRWYEDIVREYPGTKAAEAAQKKLDAMK